MGPGACLSDINGDHHGSTKCPPTVKRERRRARYRAQERAFLTLNENNREQEVLVNSETGRRGCSGSLSAGLSALHPEI